MSKAQNPYGGGFAQKNISDTFESAEEQILIAKIKRFLRRIITASKHFIKQKIFAIKRRVLRYLVFPLQGRKYDRYIKHEIVVQKRAFLWTQNFGWNVELFQRPQHIAACLSRQNNSVFYFVNRQSDPDVLFAKKISPNLFLINRNNKAFIEKLKSFVDSNYKHRYLHQYSTNSEISLKTLKEYENNGYHILYEYIDDLAPEISCTEELPENIKDIFQYVTSGSAIPMTVTADALYEEIVASRGEENLAFATNGVDSDHFTHVNKAIVYKKDFADILKRKRKIVGYYGALAKWMDYDLLKYAANACPDIEFVLIGKIYDESFEESRISEIPNIHFIGSIPYKTLPSYAVHFDLCTIPFVVNRITNATSPLKLFEYMALGKPILTTKMRESSKYKSVITSSTYSNFTEKLTELLDYKKETHAQYFDLLKKEASENSWTGKSRAILEMLDKYETKASAGRLNEGAVQKSPS